MVMNTHVTVCMPDFPIVPKATVILLHGLGGNADDWMIRAGIDYFARTANIAFVMPEVQRSWYADMAYGLDYFGYITEELPEMIRHYFNFPVDSEHLYIGGLSMGGFGSLKCVMTHPERFAGCMSFSARVYMKNKVQQVTQERFIREMQGILGLDTPTNPENDMEILVHQAAQAEKKPKLYVACGTEDPLYPESVQLRDDLNKHGFDFQYEEWAGEHNWTFWRVALPRGLKTMGLLDEDA